MCWFFCKRQAAWTRFSWPTLSSTVSWCPLAALGLVGQWASRYQGWSFQSDSDPVTFASSVLLTKVSLWCGGSGSHGLLVQPWGHGSLAVLPLPWQPGGASTCQHRGLLSMASAFLAMCAGSLCWVLLFYAFGVACHRTLRARKGGCLWKVVEYTEHAKVLPAGNTHSHDSHLHLLDMFFWL